MRRLFIYSFCLALFSVPFFSLFAQDNSAILTYRQKLMKSNAMHMSMIGDIIKNNLPFKKQIVNHANVIALNSRAMAKAWEKKIIRGRTDSKPEIWSDWEMYKKKAEMTANEAANLADLVDSGDMSAAMAQVRTLGRTCGGCHEYYRKPKGQRFKR